MGESAEKRVKTAIIVDRIAQIEGVTLSDEEFEGALSDLATSNGLAIEEVKKFFVDPHRKSTFVSEQVRNKALEFLFERAKVTFVEPKEDEQPGQDAKADKPKKKTKAKAKKAAKSE